MSAQEILEALGHTDIGIATVYRRLREGAEDRSLRQILMPRGGRRFEPANRPLHQHFECEVCRKVFDIESDSVSLCQLVPDGFKIDLSKVLLFGKCPDCVSET